MRLPPKLERAGVTAVVAVTAVAVGALGGVGIARATSAWIAPRVPHRLSEHATPFGRMELVEHAGSMAPGAPATCGTRWFEARVAVPKGRVAALTQPRPEAVTFDRSRRLAVSPLQQAAPSGRGARYVFLVHAKAPAVRVITQGDSSRTVDGWAGLVTAGPAPVQVAALDARGRVLERVAVSNVIAPDAPRICMQELR
jgi:hypothetical protein